jgi:hypothetical protein
MAAERRKHVVWFVFRGCYAATAAYSIIWFITRCSGAKIVENIPIKTEKQVKSICITTEYNRKALFRTVHGDGDSPGLRAGIGLVAVAGAVMDMGAFPDSCNISEKSLACCCSYLLSGDVRVPPEIRRIQG